MILDVALPLPVPKTFDYLAPDNLTAGEPVAGRRVKVLFGPRFITGVVTGARETSATPADRLKKIISFVDEEPIFDDASLALGRWLSAGTLCSLGEALDAMLPPKTTKQAPLAYDEIQYHVDEPHASFRESGFVLTTGQDAAIRRIHEAVYAPDGAMNKKFLLKGVSAAGKTEVYISTIKDILDQGKNAIYLAPEIGLVDQIAGILRHRFGAGRVCVWHSGRTVKERRDDWWRVRRGEFSIVVGARSAILLPMPNLGLIVVDEEQDSAWKEDRKPKFHARDVAFARAHIENATVIFGSATPSLEIFFDAKEKRVELLEMSERAVRASAPNVKLIDLKNEKMRGGTISPSLEKAIEERLAKKEQTILFINRRGFYRYLRCPECDWAAKCADCGVTMVEHKNEMTMLVCHYCSKSAPAPVVCPECGHKKLKAGGAGTERVEREIKEKFPWASVARWDRDSVRNRGEQEKILDDFQKGAIDVLVGTQLVAQGFHFPRVTLVGVINADTSLHMPDFRAAERAFQLLMQVAGRAGRDLVGGDVLIQTRHADHPVLQCASRLDYECFSREELKFRSDLSYPPFASLVKVETTAKDVSKAEKDMDGFVSWVMGLEAGQHIGVLGPTASRRKRKGVGAFHVLLKIPRDQFDEFLKEARGFFQDKTARFRIDIDPL